MHGNVLADFERVHFGEEQYVSVSADVYPFVSTVLLFRHRVNCGFEGPLV